MNKYHADELPIYKLADLHRSLAELETITAAPDRQLYSAMPWPCGG